MPVNTPFSVDTTPSNMSVQGGRGWDPDCGGQYLCSEFRISIMFSYAGTVTSCEVLTGDATHNPSYVYCKAYLKGNLVAAATYYQSPPLIYSAPLNELAGNLHLALLQPVLADEMQIFMGPPSSGWQLYLSAVGIHGTFAPASASSTSTSQPATTTPAYVIPVAVVVVGVSLLLACGLMIIVARRRRRAAAATRQLAQQRSADLQQRPALQGGGELANQMVATDPSPVPWLPQSPVEWQQPPEQWQQQQLWRQQQQQQQQQQLWQQQQPRKVDTLLEPQLSALSPLAMDAVVIDADDPQPSAPDSELEASRDAGSALNAQTSIAAPSDPYNVSRQLGYAIYAAPLRDGTGYVGASVTPSTSEPQMREQRQLITQQQQQAAAAAEAAERRKRDDDHRDHERREYERRDREQREEEKREHERREQEHREKERRDQEHREHERREHERREQEHREHERREHEHRHR